MTLRRCTAYTPFAATGNSPSPRIFVGDPGIGPRKKARVSGHGVFNSRTVGLIDGASKPTASYAYDALGNRAEIQPF